MPRRPTGTLAVVLLWCLSTSEPINARHDPAVPDCNSNTATMVDDVCYFLLLTNDNQTSQQRLPGTLAQADSQHKLDTLWDNILETHLNTSSYPFAWIGLVDAAPGGDWISLPRNWTWENGSALGWSAWELNFGIQPNGYSPGQSHKSVQDCVTIDFNGLWHDKPCNDFLCQIQIPPGHDFGSNWFQVLMTGQWFGPHSERHLVSSATACGMLCFNTANCFMFAVGTADSDGLSCQLKGSYHTVEAAPGNDWLLFYRSY